MTVPPSRYSEFRISVPDEVGRPDSPHRSPAISVLEQKHPAVTKTLMMLWGYPELNQYFDRIAAGTDPGLQLDPQAMAEIMLLAAVHQQFCPYRPARKIEEVYGAGRWSGPWTPSRGRF